MHSLQDYKKVEININGMNMKIIDNNTMHQYTICNKEHIPTAQIGDETSKCPLHGWLATIKLCLFIGRPS